MVLKGPYLVYFSSKSWFISVEMAIYFDSIGNTITNPKKRFSPYSFHAKLDEMTIEEGEEVRARPIICNRLFLTDTDYQNIKPIPIIKISNR